MSWFGSIKKTVHLTAGQLALTYWAISIAGITLNVIGSKYLKKYELQNKIAEKGLAQAMFDTFERFYDPQCKLHDDSDSDMMPKILDNTLFEILNVTIGAWGIASSLSIRSAITSSVTALLNPSGEEMDASHEERVYWISFTISMLLTLLCTAYIGRLVEAIRKGRKKLFAKIKDDKKKQLKKLQKHRPLLRQGPENYSGQDDTYNSSSELYSK